MPVTSIEFWRHDHVFLSQDHEQNERRTWIVVVLTATTMVGEIAGGTTFGSMALLADGWHMFTHAGALAIAALAYRYARRHSGDPRFAFGTGKLGDLAGFSSAIILALIALLIGWESVVRLYAPVPIRFGEAIAIAVLGLVVNLFCAWLLGSKSHQHAERRDNLAAHDHHRHGSHDHGNHQRADRGHAGHGTTGHDYNLRAAYLHVMADALTSVLAIAGLVTGRVYGWLWIDPIIGIVGALVISRWSWGLMKDAGAILVDTVPDGELARTIRERLDSHGDQVADLHLWRVGPSHNAAVISVVSERPEPPAHYKERLRGLPGLSHVTVEVNASTATRHHAA